MHIAARRGCMDIVKILLHVGDSKPDINSQDANGVSTSQN